MYTTCAFLQLWFADILQILFPFLQMYAFFQINFLFWCAMWANWLYSYAMYWRIYLENIFAALDIVGDSPLNHVLTEYSRQHHLRSHVVTMSDRFWMVRHSLLNIYSWRWNRHKTIPLKLHLPEPEPRAPSRRPTSWQRQTGTGPTSWRSDYIRLFL